MKNWSKFLRRCCFRRITASFLVFCILFSTVAPLLVAGPEDAQVVNGEVTFDRNGNYTTITASDQSIVNYSSFNIGSPETVQFIQPSSQASILNRILSANPTMIDGTLLANGRVFFINPAGVMIGGSAKINVNQLVASGLNMSNSSFLAGQYEFVGGDGTVSNSGQISAESVYLVGKQVVNAGQIDCPDGYVIMGAGDKVYLNRTGSSIVVEVDTVAPVSGQPAIDAGITNTGSVNADGGEIFLAVAGDVLARPLLANAGTLSAKGGSVTLAADEVINTGVIDVSGTTGGTAAIQAADRASQLGTVNADGITGDGGSISITADESIVLGSGSVTTANAGANGDGGEIIVYSAGQAVFADGAIAEAKGGTESGDGGFMELSGLESIELNSIVDLSAPAGLAGTLLLDPTDIWISDADPGTDASWYDTVLLEDQLNEGFISIITSGEGDGGDITVNDSVSWASLYGLELYAYRDIYVNAGITNAAAGDLTLDANRHIVVDAPISLNGGHLAMFAAKFTYETSGIWINDDITAGSMRLKTVKDEYVTEQRFSGVFVGNGAKLETVKVNGSSGDIVIEAVHDVILGSGDETYGVVVDAAGQVYINADEDGPGDPLGSSEYYPDHYDGGDLLAEGTIIARDGGVTLKGNAMELGNVTAGNGNLAITGRTSREYENSWGNIAVATDKILSASGNLDIIDAQADYANGEYDGQMRLTGDTKLTLQALGGKITSEHTAIEVTGSTLVMKQSDTLDTEDYIFFNQNTTNLELTSTGGSVISDLDESANSADKWQTITATAADDITLVGENNYAGGIRTGYLNAGTDGTGSISIKDIGQDGVDDQGDGDDGTIHAYGNMTAGTDVTLHNKTRFAGDDGTQEVTAGWIFTANGWLKKVTEGDLLLNGGASGVGINAVSLNGTDPEGVSASTYSGNLEIHGVGDVQISGHLTTFGEGEYYVYDGPAMRAYTSEIIVEEVTASNGGVSIISDEGKIYTRDGINDDTLNVNITGNSDHKAETSLGVDLPKNYDITGKAAIVIMSEDELKLGPDGILTAEGTYYDDGSVDDRPSVDFLDHDIPADDKLGGIAIDIAIFLASNGGSVDVGSPVADLPDGAAMVADAYETVTFGTVFEEDLVAGNVDWLEVSSRMSTSWDDVWNSGTPRLPYVGPDGMDTLPWTTSYIPRIENLDVGTGAWIPGDDDSPTLPIRDLTRASSTVPPTLPEPGGIGPIEGSDNLTWLAEELGLCSGDQKGNDENRCQEMHLYMAGAFMQSSDIQPYGAATRLRELAATLHDPDGSHVAALGRVVNEFANPDLPPSPEMITSIMTAFDAHTNDGTHYATAAQWLEAMTEYVIILNSDIGWDMDKSVAFIMGKYGSGITERGQVSVIAFVQMHLENIGG